MIGYENNPLPREEKDSTDERVAELMSQPVTEDDIYEMCEWLTRKDSINARESIADVVNSENIKTIGAFFLHYLSGSRADQALNKAIDEECKK